MPVEEAAPPFELEGARVVRGSRTVLDAVSLTVASGRLVALLGANGAGKTTLVCALLGLLPLDEGRAEVFGRLPGHRATLRRVGYVPQRFTAVTGVPATAGEVVLSGRVARARLGLAYRAADRAAAQEALDAVGLPGAASTPVANLSGGQQRRVLIARALAASPDALVLDEPFSGVDSQSQAALAVALGALKDRGVAILMVEHSLGALEGLVDRAVVLAEGRIVFEGLPRDAARHTDAFEHHHGDDTERRKG
jgi:zinc transport system ATP-binding protein